MTSCSIPTLPKSHLYFTYFAPPRGEPAAAWPITHFYEDVWTKPFAERRTMDLGTERVARAKLSEDYSTLTDVDVLAEVSNETSCSRLTARCSSSAPIGSASTTPTSTA